MVVTAPGEAQQRAAWIAAKAQVLDGFESYDGVEGDGLVDTLIAAGDALVERVEAMQLQSPGRWCDVCFTSSWSPCPEGTKNAVKDGRGKFMVCDMCATHEALAAAVERVEAAEKQRDYWNADRNKIAGEYQELIGQMNVCTAARVAAEARVAELEEAVEALRVLTPTGAGGFVVLTNEAYDAACEALKLLNRRAGVPVAEPPPTERNAKS